MDQATDAAATIDAWRARGDDRLDPVRFRLIEAMARRTAAHHGEARRILDDKLGRLVLAYGEELEKHSGADGEVAPKTKGQTQRGPLAELVEHMTRHASSHADDSQTAKPVPTLASKPEHKALAFFRSTWSRLSANKRLTQSLAKVPGNAGPLNSHHLVHRSLTLMRNVSPEYLNRFMAYVDALQWLEQVNGGNGLSGGDGARAEGQKKGARGKSA
ncbi:DUF2894 domain-containing protein [Variovorax sp. J22R133]|uniref:DUF2894 domain-containing protein n=1 Tax=Variovorax brevis TaxID=3053503 RepID=UPI0025779F92|nr:DUF2894 domain-containing protein [Variovorax sp. J22R133]MDM0114134.1 DUF2894 domain-containing protein [Variovorax sp. J22R133]